MDSMIDRLLLEEILKYVTQYQEREVSQVPLHVQRAMTLSMVGKMISLHLKKHPEVRETPSTDKSVIYWQKVAGFYIGALNYVLGLIQSRDLYPAIGDSTLEELVGTLHGFLNLDLPYESPYFWEEYYQFGHYKAGKNSDQRHPEFSDQKSVFIEYPPERTRK